jgi:prephenate dehydrogenase
VILGIIGTGLIGGSLALALRAAGRVSAVRGYDQDRQASAEALARGIIDSSVPCAADAAAEADVVVIAVPVGAIAQTFSAVAPALKASAFMMDVGSTKVSVLASARATLGARLAAFVPTHPIAGGEVSGPQAARADLFRNRYAILTPGGECDAHAIARATALWEAAGARVARMDAAHHDRVFSAVSHLPHLLSFALVEAFARRADAPELFRFAGGGFRDMARIAGSSPSMWRDIALANREAILADLGEYQAALARLRTALEGQDGPQLAEGMQIARAMRARWLAGEFD